MPKDKEAKAEKKAKREKRKSEIAPLPVDPVLVEGKQTDGDVEMHEPSGVQVVLKDKKSKKDKDDEIIISVEDLSPIAHPLANKKLLKKLYRTVKKASKQRQVKRGVKEIVKGIRKGDKGLLVLAADISPMDIISHLPVLSEDNSIPYIFVSSKEELGHASSTKRPTSCVLVCPDMKRKRRKAEDGSVIEEKDEDYRELYDECYNEVKALDENVVY